VMGLGAIWLILLIVVSVAALIALTSAFGSSGRRGTDEDRARAILRERLAAGEIDEHEYQERLDVLTDDRAGGGSGADRSSTVTVVLAAAALISALLVLTVATFGGGWRPMGDHPADRMHHMTGQRSSSGTAPEPLPEAPEIAIEASEMWFEPATIEVTAGEPINLTLDNRGDVLHDLTIDELDLRIEAQPGQRASAGLGSIEPGEYAFYCSVPGHDSAGMRGTLIVTDPGR
jgi:plastocyanin